MNTDAYLRENNRQKVITMILIGGWVEAQHIAVSLSKGSPKTNEQLTESIMAQKVVITSYSIHYTKLYEMLYQESQMVYSLYIL